jgi:histidinol phosphatase-like PHP family hydrolase
MQGEKTLNPRDCHCYIMFLSCPEIDVLSPLDILTNRPLYSQQYREIVRFILENRKALPPL